MKDRNLKQRIETSSSQTAMKKPKKIHEDSSNDLMELGLPVIEIETQHQESSDDHILALATIKEASLLATNSLFSSWILDGAGGRHICNASMKDRLSKIHHNEKGFLTGETVTASTITGSSYIDVETGSGKRRVPINKVTFTPGFYCNILSCKLLCQKGV